MIGPGGATIPAASIDLQDASTAYATFDLTGAPAGSYTVVATATGSAMAQLVAGLTVQSGTGGSLETYLSGPSDVLVGGTGDLYVNYANTGNNDLGAPLVYVISPSGTSIGLDHLLPRESGPRISASSPSGPPGMLAPRPHEPDCVLPGTRDRRCAERFPDRDGVGRDHDPIDWGQIDPWILPRTGGPELDRRIRVAAAVGWTHVG